MKTDFNYFNYANSLGTDNYFSKLTTMLMLNDMMNKIIAYANEMIDKPDKINTINHSKEFFVNQILSLIKITTAPNDLYNINCLWFQPFNRVQVHKKGVFSILKIKLKLQQTYKYY